MRISRRTVLAGAGALAGCGRRKGSRFNGYAFIANRSGGSVAAVDLADFVLAGQIPVPGPSEVAAAGKRVFVLSPAEGSLHEIDAETRRLTRTARLVRAAVSMRLAPGGDALWIACADPPSLVRVALDPWRVAQRLRLPEPPRDFDLARNGAHAATAGSSVRVSDLRTGALHRYSVARDPRLVRFRMDWEPRQLMIGDTAERSIVVADLQTGRAVVRLALPLRPERFCTKSDGGELFVSGPGMDAVVTVFPFSTEIGETLLAGKAPGAMAISPAPEYLFVANPSSGDVTILDIQTRKLAGLATVGKDPAAILFTPDHNYALVLNRGSGDAAVIRMQTIRGNRSKTAPLFTMIPVGQGPVAGVVVAA